MLSQVREDGITHEQISFLRKAVITAQEPIRIPLPKLDTASLSIAGHADASFANNADMPSQLRFVVLLRGKPDSAAIVHYGSWKCWHVTRPVLGSEVYAFSHAIDFVLALCQDLSSLLS